ncbi:MAG: aromatic ring-hydroxylating dioxygenase subunit alpha [Gammaproteobacteria bacterium]|nr:aromatic ring-hydroxylating dioxygenase subunit alpha [Gammaproteobacteria bacterium]
MNRDTEISLLKRIVELVENRGNQLGESGNLQVAHYIDPAHTELEMEGLFKGFPILAGHIRQLPKQGSYISLDIGHTPVIVIRDREDQLHALVNACRHRGARLATEPCGAAKAFSCPYHAWVYKDNGELHAISEPEAFPDVNKSELGLKRLPISEAAGMLWVTPGTQAQHDEGMQTLQPVIDDLSHFGLGQHVVKKTAIQHPRCNWKLVIDAFSEGYHLKTLHKNSVKQFFAGAGTIFDAMGPHTRTVGARREIEDYKNRDEQDWDFRGWTTPFYTLFPNTVLVFHPDWISRITVFPEGPDLCRVHHDMWVQEDAGLDDDYLSKTFKLINEVVFAAEDIAMCEQIQSAARAGVDTEWRIGGIETPVLWFHQACWKALGLDSSGK